MKRGLSVLLAMMLALTMGLAAAEDAGAGSGDQISGHIEDGAYVLSVQVDPEDPGAWSPDEMAQDDSVVRLVSAGTEGGVMTLRYEPVGDGQITVALRHTNWVACDRMYTLDLTVKDGKVQEVSGGSYTASPADEELDAAIAGEWLEDETQFHSLYLTLRPEGGWDAEIAAPMTHGGWILRAVVYFDCELNALMYNDGTLYDLIPGEETQEQVASIELEGAIYLGGTEEDIKLTWFDGDLAGENGMSFGRYMRTTE